MVNDYNQQYFQHSESWMIPNMASTAHDYHVMEFEQMCKQLISSALQEHDQMLQIDVQTMLNGHPCTMSGLDSDIKKQISSALQKAFRR